MGYCELAYELGKALLEADTIIERQKNEIRKLKSMYSNTIEIKLQIHERNKILEKRIEMLENEIKTLRGEC